MNGPDMKIIEIGAKISDISVNDLRTTVQGMLSDKENVHDGDWEKTSDGVDISYEIQKLENKAHELCLSKAKKEEYIESAIQEGIYINQTPLWEKMPIFYRCQNLLKEFPFIQQNDLYIKKWGREIKVLNKYFIGQMYILKQFFEEFKLCELLGHLI